MNFEHVGDDKDLMCFNVYTDGEVSVGIHPVMYGFRVRVWPNGSGGCDVDICCGDNPAMVDMVFRTILNYLEDGGSPKAIPFQERKPYPAQCYFREWFHEVDRVTPVEHDTFIPPRELMRYRREANENLKNLMSNQKS